MVVQDEDNSNGTSSRQQCSTCGSRQHNRANCDRGIMGRLLAGMNIKLYASNWEESCKADYKDIICMDWLPKFRLMIPVTLTAPQNIVTVTADECCRDIPSAGDDDDRQEDDAASVRSHAPEYGSDLEVDVGIPISIEEPAATFNDTNIEDLEVASAATDNDEGEKDHAASAKSHESDDDDFEVVPDASSIPMEEASGASNGTNGEEPLPRSHVVSGPVVPSCKYPGCSRVVLQLNPCIKPSCQNVLHHLCGQEFTSEKGMYQGDDANDSRQDQSKWCFDCNSIANTNESSTTVGTAAFPFGPIRGIEMHAGTVLATSTSTSQPAAKGRGRGRGRATGSGLQSGSVPKVSKRWKI